MKTFYPSLLVGLLALLAVVVFRPAISAELNRKEQSRVIVGFVFTDIPRNWLEYAYQHAIRGQKPCKTIFCSRSDATVDITIMKEAQGGLKNWAIASGRTFESFGFPKPIAYQLSATTGAFECLKSQRGGRSPVIISTCANEDFGLVLTFSGAPSGLDRFHRIVQTARFGD